MEEIQKRRFRGTATIDPVHGTPKMQKAWMSSFMSITPPAVRTAAQTDQTPTGTYPLRTHTHRCWPMGNQNYTLFAKAAGISQFGELPLEVATEHVIHAHAHHTQGRMTKARPGSESSPTWPLDKKYILVVDDEASVREVTAEILREANVRTLEAEDGLVGLELFRRYSRQIVLVLLDFSMPGMNGGQVLEQMWEIDDSVPILFFSGYGQHETIRRFRRLGSVGFLQKPYTINELLLAVRQHLKSG